MADKPTRKAPAKRGPTKAAALKALGLTQEDLDYLKERHEPPVTEAVAPTEQPPEGYEFVSSSPELLRRKREAEDEARMQAEPVPNAAPTHEVHVPEVETVPTWYVRNLRNMEVSYRLTRQQKQGEKRTTLKPRGQRGDTARLDHGDLNDSELQTQLAYGLVEILPEGEALEVIRKQSFNSQVAQHPALAMLTNERGESYQQGAVRTVSDEEAFGYKVADLKPVVEGELGEIQVGRGGIQRELAPQQVGNPAIVSQSPTAPVQTSGNLGAVDPNSLAKDALARAKNLEGPVAGLGNVNVTVEEVRRT